MIYERSIIASALVAGAAALALALQPASCTHAAVSSLQAQGVGPAFVRALHAARTRAQELGQAFG